MARTHSFVGRETEWERLYQWYTTARQGVRQVGFMAGKLAWENGPGRSVCVARRGSRAGVSRPWTVHRALRGWGSVPSAPCSARPSRARRGRTHLVELLRVHAPSWLIHLPALLPRDDHGALLRVAHQSTPARMLRELAECWRSSRRNTSHPCTRRSALSDTATLAWLAYVARRRDPARLLVLGTYRPFEVIVQPHPLRTLIAELRQQPQCAELVLDYLSAADVAAYLRQRCGRIARLEDLAAVLHQRTSGHPLFLVTLVDELMRQRLLVASEAAWDIRGDLDAVTTVVPRVCGIH